MTLFKETTGLYRGGNAAVSVRLSGLGRWMRIRAVDVRDRTAGLVQPDAPAVSSVSGRPCVMSLPGEQVFLRVLAFSAQSGMGLGEAVAEQIPHFEDMGQAETVQAIGVPRRLGSRRAVVFALARAEAVDAAFSDAASGDARIENLVPASLALYNGALAQLRVGRGPLLTLLVGPDATDAFLGLNRIPLMARRLSVGMRAFGPDEAAAEAWDLWMDELKSALEFASSLWPERKLAPTRAVICAPDLLPPLELERLRVALGIEFHDAGRFPLARRHQAGPGFLPALGCALAGLGRAAIPLGVLPAAALEQQRLARQAPWWVAAAVCAVLGMSLPAVHLHRARVLERRRAARLEGRVASMAAMENELIHLKERNRALLEEMAPLRGTVYGSEIVRRVLQAVASSKHEEDWIILVADAERYMVEGRASLVRGGPRSRIDAPLEHVVVEGYTPFHDLSTVRAMIERLRRYPFIKKADLLADDRLRQDPDRDVRWAPLHGRLFALELRVVSP